MFMFIYFCITSVAGAVEFTPSFDVSADSVYLVNLDTDTVIYQKNAELEQMPSTLVNIMAAAIILEECSNPETVTITADSNLFAEFSEYEHPDDLRFADIQNGDVLTVQDYLYAMMLASSCEAANILANHFGNQNISVFVEKMNKKAEKIGADNTVFCNPHGLYDPGQVTTAKDIAIITQYALSVPGFEEIATAEDYEITPQSTVNTHSNPWRLTHSNVMMSAASDFYLFGVEGIKTGNLQISGRNLVTLGSYDGIRYLLVLLNAPFYDEDGDAKYYHLIDACNIMEWAFENFQYKDLLSSGEEIAEIKVSDSDGSGYVLVKPQNDYSTLWYDEVDLTSIKRDIRLYENVSAPVRKGQKLGEIELKLSDEVIAKIDLVAASDVERSFVKFNLSTAKDFFGSKWMNRAFIISGLLISFYLFVCIAAYIYAKKSTKGSFSNKKVVKKLYRNKRR